MNSDLKVKKCLLFPKFEDNKVSTKTIIASSNITIDMNVLFEKLPTIEYTIVPKKRGRKRKVSNVDPNVHLENGSIITVKYEDKIKGVDLKKKSKMYKKKNGKYFRNSLSIVMIIDNKKINFKASKNGKFQITGCKSDVHAETCMKYFWKYIEEYGDVVYKFKNIESFEVIFIPAMRNIDFDLGFLVDREKLSKYINLMTQYYSMLEASFGYTGVNIKFPMKDDIIFLELKKISYKNKSWTESKVTYNDYLDNIDEKDKEKKLQKNRYNTFLVFHSGKVIMSGMTAEFMKDTYYEFLEIINMCYDKIEEILE